MARRAPFTPRSASVRRRMDLADTTANSDIASKPLMRMSETISRSSSEAMGSKREVIDAKVECRGIGGNLNDVRPESQKQEAGPNARLVRGII